MVVVLLFRLLLQVDLLLLWLLLLKANFGLPMLMKNMVIMISSLPKLISNFRRNFILKNPWIMIIRLVFWT